MAQDIQSILNAIAAQNAGVKSGAPVAQSVANDAYVDAAEQIRNDVNKSVADNESAQIKEGAETDSSATDKIQSSGNGFIDILRGASDGLNSFNNGIGDIIDKGVVDQFGNLVEGLTGQKEWGENIRNATNGQQLSMIPALAEAGLVSLIPGVGAPVGLGLLGAVESGNEIANAISGKDERGNDLTDSQKAANGLNAALGVGLNALGGGVLNKGKKAVEAGADAMGMTLKDPLSKVATSSNLAGDAFNSVKNGVKGMSSRMDDYYGLNPNVNSLRDVVKGAPLSDEEFARMMSAAQKSGEAVSPSDIARAVQSGLEPNAKNGKLGWKETRDVNGSIYDKNGMLNPVRNEGGKGVVGKAANKVKDKAGVEPKLKEVPRDRLGLGYGIGQAIGGGAGSYLEEINNGVDPTEAALDSFSIPRLVENVLMARAAGKIGNAVAPGRAGKQGAALLAMPAMASYGDQMTTLASAEDMAAYDQYVKDMASSAQQQQYYDAIKALYGQR